MSDAVREAKGLATHFEGLRTFDDANRFDAEAQRVAEALEAERAQATAQAGEAQRRKDELETARRALPFFKRLFSSRSQEKAAAAEIAQLVAHVAQLEEVGEVLLTMIDYTPNNAKDQKAILKELRAEKKQLQIEKKEVSTHARAIRTAARKRSADAWSIFGARVVAEERRSIRRQKEAMLAPHENELAAIERRMLAVEKRIAWVQRFGAADEDE
jgi:hypothetical protein